jgi:hypothetical protein
MPKIHLVPLAANRKWALCSARIREAERHPADRKAFNALPRAERCGRCDAIVNGKEDV